MTATRRRRPRVLGALVVLVCLPLSLVVADATVFHARSRCNGTLVSSGETRKYLLHVPSGYDRDRRLPLVISLHPAALWPAVQREMSQWDRVADENGFLVVYPAATDPSPIWHAEEGPDLARDVRFISDLIDTLQATYAIDPARIYVNGLSNGGGMTFALSCTLSDRIAAVGMVGAAQTLPFKWCPDPRPVPMISFHGTADRFVPYRGGPSPVPNAPLFPSVLRFSASWARRNRCGTEPLRSVVAPDVIRSEYPGCAGGADVVLYTIEGGGHTWPGGHALPDWMLGTTSRGIDASREMWSFFEKHPLTARTF